MYFKELLCYRKIWLGFALSWIMLFHYPLSLGPFQYFASIGYGGVDICLFASGIGCFYSLSADTDIVKFLKRRLKRLAPTYIIFILAWLAFQYLCGKFNFQMAVGNILAIQNFTGNGRDFNWYISAIFLMYILAPYFKIIAQEADLQHKSLFLAFLIVCSIPFWRANTYIITITRLPIYYIGMLFADMCQKDIQISKKHIFSIILSFALGVIMLGCCIIWAEPYLWSYGLYWYPFILITPPLCIAISYLSSVLNKTKATKLVLSFFSLCGEYSFELYLLHILLASCITYTIDVFDLSRYGRLIWMAGLIPLFLGCVILRRASVCITSFLEKSNKNT